MLRVLFLVTIIVTMLVMPGSTQAQSEGVFQTPQEMLQSYYHAINARNLAGAYAHWRTPSQSFEDFEAGFWRTNRVTPYFGEFEVSSSPLSGQVQAVLVADETDYSVQDAQVFRTYAGCFFVNRTRTVGDWRITGADITQLLDFAPPNLDTIEAALSRNCTQGINNTVQGTLSYSNAASILTLYFTLISQRDYATAYNYWLSPADGVSQDYRLSFDQFSSGYAETQAITVYNGEYVFGGAAAGRAYLDGIMPVVVVAEDTDGSFSAYAGCFVMGFNARNNSLGIVNARFYTVSNTVPTGNLIADYLQIDCLNLGIPN